MVSSASNFYGWITIRNAPWMETLNRYVIRTIETGLFKKNNEWSKFDWNSCHDSEAHKLQVFNLKHVEPVFYFLIGGLSISMISFVLEVIVGKFEVQF